MRMRPGRAAEERFVRAAIELIAERRPGSLAAPEWLEHVATCIEDDDLESAGISRAELESMLAGPNRENVKNWIEGLPTETRVIFVLAGGGGFTANETAEMLADHGGKGAERWNAGSGAGDLPAGTVFAGFAVDPRSEVNAEQGNNGSRSGPTMTRTYGF